MKVKIYRSVSNWSRDVVFKVEKLQNLLSECIFFIAQKQQFDLRKINDYTIEASVKFVADYEMKKFNGKYRQQDKPTNVLSFPSFDIKKNLQNLSPNVTKKQVYIGDIVLAYQTIQKEANEQNKAIEAHITHLYIHSILHLLGFDHIKKEERNEMEALEIEILEKMNIVDIY